MMLQMSPSPDKLCNPTMEQYKHDKFRYVGLWYFVVVFSFKKPLSRLDDVRPTAEATATSFK
jgi:hypothetical protein